MDERRVALARLDQFQVAWQRMLEAASRESVPSLPRTPEDRLRADIKNEAIWLLNSLNHYRSIPLEERY
jgi:hypothetical protein